jgi:hypothetical protein
VGADRVSKKISILRDENIPQRQAVAMALSMNRAGRLTSGGEYIHSRKKKRFRSRRKSERS